jgi:predicted HicB family RNase H-like nuclease
MVKKTSLRSLAVNAPKEAEPPQQVAEKPEPDNSKAMSLRVPPALWKELQLRKLDEERSVNAIIIDAIQAYLKGAGGKASH